jgi:hypothetical protein
LTEKHSNTKIHQFIKLYIASKKAELIESEEIITVKYRNQTNQTEYTYEPTVAKERKLLLLTLGTPAFQQIMKECLQKGILCQIILKPRDKIDKLLKKQFKDSTSVCDDCLKVTQGQDTISVCSKSQPCYHQINGAKIVSVKILKNDPVRYFKFYYSVKFSNKLRPKNEEMITILLDENCNIIDNEDSLENNFLNNENIDFQDFNGKIKATVFDALKAVADQELDSILKEKLALFDLMLYKERQSKLRSFDKRLRRERREQIISRKQEFDQYIWQANYEKLLKREEESFITTVAVKFTNLLVINTDKIKFEVNLDNDSTIRAFFILGIDHTSRIYCPICRRLFWEGYATEDALYVCKNCVRQSIDTAKIYSKKADLKLDETLNEYIEHEAGFICSVCGKKHSRLLEFKCSHDNSSVCIYHYGLCDICGKDFSRLNLSSTQEFKRTLCPKHAVECANCQSIIGVDETKICKATGKKLCNDCISFTKCSSCQQEYFIKSLTADKCPACTNLKDLNDKTFTSIIKNFDNTKHITTKWLVGKNALNTIVVRKNLLSDSKYMLLKMKKSFMPLYY